MCYGCSRELVSQHAAYLGSLGQINAMHPALFLIAGGPRIALKEFSQGHSCGFSVSNPPTNRDSLATGQLRGKR